MGEGIRVLVTDLFIWDSATAARSFFISCLCAAGRQPRTEYDA